MSAPKLPTVEQLQQLPGPGFASMTPAGMVAPGDMVRTRSGWVLVDSVQRVGGRLALRCSDGSDHLTTAATLWHVNSGERWADGWEPVAADPDFQAVEVLKALRAVRALIEVTVSLGSGDRAKAQGFDAIAELMGVEVP